VTIILRLLAPRVLGPALMVGLALVVKGYTDVGDGFAAGVIVALAVGLRYVVLGTERTEATLPLVRWAPQIALCGLLVSLAVCFAGVAFGDPPFTHVPGPGETVATIGTLELSTPVLFDLGVFLLVAGALTTVLHHLALLREGRT
jgi:multisubunit Na+/H+ antiporter MnhB subunit